MFFELTEVLTCPDCGPSSGLILLVQEVRDRRVESGWLGCPNCQRDFPVEAGVADIRLDREAEAPEVEPIAEDELAVKVAALCGLTEGQGYVLLDERLVHVAEPLAERVPGLEVIAFLRAPGRSVDVRHGVSWVASDVPFPIGDNRLRGIAIAPAGDPDRVGTAARTLRAGGRLVMFDVRDVDVERAEEEGLRILARDEDTLVAERADPFAPTRG